MKKLPLRICPSINGVFIGWIVKPNTYCKSKSIVECLPTQWQLAHAHPPLFSKAKNKNRMNVCGKDKYYCFHGRTKLYLFLTFVDCSHISFSCSHSFVMSFRCENQPILTPLSITCHPHFRILLSFSRTLCSFTSLNALSLSLSLALTPLILFRHSLAS